MRIPSVFRLDLVVIVSVAGLSMLSGEILADEARLSPLRDATLIESSTGALANGSGPAFFAGRTSQGSGSRRRALLAFDVAPAVPTGSTITGAFLTLNMNSTSGGPAVLSLRRLLAAWGEGSSSSAGGGGAPSVPGDVTWIHTFYDTAFWTAPGGDFDPATRASALVDQPGAYTWGASAGMIADVQAWADAPGENYGWILIGDETSSTTVKRFDSRESSEEALRPILTVEYIPPCIPADPVGPGYWQRQCLGLQGIDGSGIGPASPTEPDFADRIAPCAERILARLGFAPLTACEAIGMKPPRDPCEQALRRLATLALDVCANRIQTSCPIEDPSTGCSATTVGDLLAETADLIRSGECSWAARCAAAVPGE